MADDPNIAALERQIARHAVNMKNAETHILDARLSGDQQREDEAVEAWCASNHTIGMLQSQRQQYEAQQAVAPRQNPRNLTDVQMEHAKACGVTADEYADGIEACARAGRFTAQNGMGRR